jgi:iron complex transport system ATP-binding protein
MIKIKNVSVKRAEKEILKNVSWLVEKGEHWCLLGLNGSGKTTLLNIINGYIWPTKGQVEVLSRKFGETNLSELRKEIGWVSSSLQQRFRDDDTVVEMILSGKFASIGLYEQVEQKDMNQAIELMQLLNCADLQNQAYGTLSQGERQRVLIARALWLHQSF